MEALPESSPVPSPPQWITPDQAALWQQFIRFMFDFGLLDRDEVAQVLLGFVLRDVDGREWTVGAETGQWYWRDPRGGWTAGEPPSALRPPDLDLSRFRRPSLAAEEAEALTTAQASPPSARAPEPGGPAPSPAPGLTNTGSCPACGAPGSPGQAFCVHCGAPARPAASAPRPPGLCSACRTQNAPGSRFCAGCGGSLAG